MDIKRSEQFSLESREIKTILRSIQSYTILLLINHFGCSIQVRPNVSLLNSQLIVSKLIPNGVRAAIRMFTDRFVGHIYVTASYVYFSVMPTNNLIKSYSGSTRRMIGYHGGKCYSTTLQLFILI